MKSETIRVLGLYMVIISGAFFFLTIGSFGQYYYVVNLLTLVFLSGVFLSLGIAMITAHDREERKFYRARKRREEKLKQEIINVREKEEAANR